jgi:hypothetical protein
MQPGLRRAHLNLLQADFREIGGLHRPIEPRFIVTEIPLC